MSSLKNKSAFITFEGIEGSGKSTQISLLASHLEKQGLFPSVFVEPGGSKIGEQIRQILLNPSHKNMTYMTELLLYQASRSQLVETKIKPSLAVGRVVLCDRYTDSSIAYQHYGRGINKRLIEDLNTIATGGLEPDLTLVLDLPVQTALGRATKNGADRIEQEAILFHQKVAKGYRLICKQNSKRCKLIDASQAKDQVFQQILSVVEATL